MRGSFSYGIVLLLAWILMIYALGLIVGASNNEKRLLEELANGKLWIEYDAAGVATWGTCK